MKIILNWLAFIGVITMNALANILPINGLNTGQVSGFYPNAFVPAGFTFSIWGIIYLMLLNYTIAYTYYKLKPIQFEQVNKYLDRINNFYLGTCILNMAWIIAWHYLQIEISVLIMLLFLSTLILLFLKSKTMMSQLTITQRLLLHTPFMVYFGWISVATIANITALLVAYQWNGFGLNEMYWSVIMIFIAFVLGIVMLKNHQNEGFAIVLVWAFFGIQMKQGRMYPVIQSMTTIAIGYLLLMTFISFVKRYKQHKIA